MSLILTDSFDLNTEGVFWIKFVSDDEVKELVGEIYKDDVTSFVWNATTAAVLTQLLSFPVETTGEDTVFSTENVYLAYFPDGLGFRQISYRPLGTPKVRVDSA